MEDRIKLKTIMIFSSLLIFLTPYPGYSQEEGRRKVEDRIKTEMVKIDMEQLQVNNESLLCLIDSFVLNGEYRTRHRKDYIHRVWADSNYCAIMILLQRKSITLSDKLIGIFWRNDIPFVVVGGDNPDGLFSQTGEKEDFCFERTTIESGGEIFDYPLNPEEFVTWVFKRCGDKIEFVEAQLPGGVIRSDVSFSFDQSCCE